MSGSLARPWIEKYCTTIAEEHGRNISKAPQMERKHRVQLIEFLTYPVKEDDIIWMNVSDKQYYLPVKLTEEAIDNYNKVNRVVNNEGLRITKRKLNVALISRFRPSMARVPLGNNQGMSATASLILEVGYIEVVGGNCEEVFGEPKHIEEHEDLVEWIKGLRNEESGDVNFLKKAKEVRAQEKATLNNNAKERQTTLPKTSSLPTAARLKSSKQDQPQPVAANQVEKQKEQKNEPLEAYKKSWKEVCRYSDAYSIIPEEALVKHLSILRFGKGIKHKLATPDSVLPQENDNSDHNVDAKQALDRSNEDDIADELPEGPVESNARQTTPSEWEMSQVEGEGRDGISSESRGSLEDKLEAKGVKTEDNAGVPSDNVAPQEENSDSEEDAMLADDSMNIVQETPPCSQSTHEHASQTMQKPPKCSQHHTRDGENNDSVDHQNAQANSNMFAEPSIPFPTPAQREFGSLPTPREFNSPPVTACKDMSSQEMLLKSSQPSSNNDMSMRRSHRATVVLVPNSDTSGTTSQSQSLRQGTQTQAESSVQDRSEFQSSSQPQPASQSQPRTQSQSLSQSQSIHLLYPQTRSPSRNEVKQRSSHDISEFHKILIPATQSDSQTQPESMDAMSQQSRNVVLNETTNISHDLSKGKTQLSQSQTESDNSRNTTHPEPAFNILHQETGQNLTGKQPILESPSGSRSDQSQEAPLKKAKATEFSGTGAPEKKQSKTGYNDVLMDEDDLKAQAMLERANSSTHSLQQTTKPSASSTSGQQMSVSTIREESPSVKLPTLPMSVDQSTSSRVGPSAGNVIVIDSDSDDLEGASRRSVRTANARKESKKKSKAPQGTPSASSPKEATNLDEMEYVILPTKHDALAWKTASFLQPGNAGTASTAQSKGKAKEAEVGMERSSQSKVRLDARDVPEISKVTVQRESRKRGADDDLTEGQPSPSVDSTRGDLPLPSKRLRIDQSSNGLRLNQDGKHSITLPLLGGFTMDLNVYKGEDGNKWLNWQDTCNILLKIGRLRHRELLKRNAEE